MKTGLTRPFASHRSVKPSRCSRILVDPNPGVDPPAGRPKTGFRRLRPLRLKRYGTNELGAQRSLSRLRVRNQFCIPDLLVSPPQRRQRRMIEASIVLVIVAATVGIGTRGSMCRGGSHGPSRVRTHAKVMRTATQPAQMEIVQEMSFCCPSAVLSPQMR
jgi:hypothetical protein